MRNLIQLTAAVLVFPNVQAETVQFFYNQQQDVCNWSSTSIPATNSTSNGGLCAYVSSINRVYACPAPDPACWTFGQTCTANNGTAPGPRQIQCDHGGTIWCCQNEETCTVTKNQINVCISQFTSPNSGVSKADAAAKEFSASPLSKIPTTVVKSTPSVIKATTFVAATAGTTTAKTTSNSVSASKQSTQLVTASVTGDVAASSSTPQEQNSTSSGSGLSGGAIAGLVVGVLAGLAMIAGAVIYFSVVRRRTTKNSYDSTTEYHEVPDTSGSGIRTEMQFANEGIYHSTGIGTSGLGRLEVEVRHELQ